MDYSTATLGRGIVAQLRDRVEQPLLRIGRDHYTRHDLAIADCFSFKAAQNLNAAIAKLNVKDTRDLFRSVEPEQLALPNVGAFSFAVLGTCFEQRGVGSLDDWVERSRAKGSRIVTFATIKQHISAHTTKQVRKTRLKRVRQVATDRATAADVAR